MSFQSLSQTIKNFEIISKLGQGSFGQVYKVKYIPTSEIYALKKIKVHRISQKDKDNALNQIRVLASCSNANIIGYKDSFYDDTSSSLCLILQYAQQGDLARKINISKKQGKKIDEKQIWKAMVQLASGINYLQQNNIIHRDLKPANIFITTNGTYKIGDMNICKIMKRQLTKTQTGTPYYASPQIWKGKSYGNKVDIWSLGCILYEMATKRPPFLANSVPQLKQKVLRGVYPNISSNEYSQQLSQMINLMLKQNPSLRPDANEILTDSIVIKNYKGQLNSHQKQKKHKLLQTIKFNNRSWKKLNFPKSNLFQKQIFKTENSQQKLRAMSYQRPISARESQKSVQKIEKQKKNLYNYIEKNKKQLQKIEEIKKLKQTNKNKQRTLSACGGQRVKLAHQSPQKLIKQPSRQNSKQKLPQQFPPKPKITCVQKQGLYQKVNNIIHKPPTARKISSNNNNQESFPKQNLKNAGKQILKNNSPHSKQQNALQKTIKKLNI